MNTLTAVLSMLHQSPPWPSSAARLFRSEPVLAWTLRRLSLSNRITTTAVLCWDDQLPNVRPIAAANNAHVLAKSPRVQLPMVQAVAAARKWCDGWRGSLLGTCAFDQGFHAPWISEIQKQFNSDVILLIDPDSALVDPTLIDSLVDHARQHPSIEYCFSPAAPGLSGFLLRPSLLDRLAANNAYPGRMLNYWPDLPGRDPISRDECAPVPAPVARTTSHFTLDSDRQVARLERATISLNGQLLHTESQALVHAAAQTTPPDLLPRDIVLELNTTRATRPLYWPGRHLSISRPNLTLPIAQRLFSELAAMDDIRLTLAGVGDPLLAPDLIGIIHAAHAAGIHSIHLETDLLPPDPSILQQLADCPLDIFSVHIPALAPATYYQLMGIDALGSVIANLRQFLLHRQTLSRATPILVPTFTKCLANLHEMESWYDHWLRAVGCAVIVGPTDYAGQIPDPAAADMTPPARCPCRRLASRLTILSDATVVSCEQDMLPRESLGHLANQSLREIHQTRFTQFRHDHASAHWHSHPLCQSCRDWHRP